MAAARKVGRPSGKPLPLPGNQWVGFVGLRNQGATCYMNSALQALYHLPVFRSAVFLMTVEEAAAKPSIALALQRLFFAMSHRKRSVCTRNLTQSFGWTSEEAWVQHDVQEFLRVLTEHLDEKTKKGELVEEGISHLFAGVTEPFVRCTEVECVSVRRETFHDLQLNVKGCESLYKSLQQYVEEEALTGANQYRAEGHGLQNAKKGIHFIHFPPVLQLQLKRFEFDKTSRLHVKVNSHFEFPAVLDLSPFVKRSGAQTAGEDLPPADSYVYCLHSVLVHSGSVSGGHYYAFVRPFEKPKEAHGEEKEVPREEEEEEEEEEALVRSSMAMYSKSPWFKFDDSRVTRVPEREAVEGSFGGPARWGGKVKHFANAYMLVYIRRDFVDLQYRTLQAMRVPQHLKDRFSKELEAEERGKRIAAQARQFSTVLVLVEQELTGRAGSGPVPLGAELEMDLEDLFAPLDCRESEAQLESSLEGHTHSHHGDWQSVVQWRQQVLSATEKVFVRNGTRVGRFVFRLRRKATFVELAPFFAWHFGILPQNQQFWVFSRRQNCVVRPNEAVDPYSTVYATLGLSAFLKKHGRRFNNVLYLRNRRHAPTCEHTGADGKLVLIKFAPSLKDCFRLLGSALVGQTTKIADISAWVSARSGCATNDFRFMEEIRTRHDIRGDGKVLPVNIVPLFVSTQAKEKRICDIELPSRNTMVTSRLTLVDGDIWVCGPVSHIQQTAFFHHMLVHTAATTEIECRELDAKGTKGSTKSKAKEPFRVTICTKRDRLKALTEEIAKRVQCDPNDILISKHSVRRGGPMTPPLVPFTPSGRSNEVHCVASSRQLTAGQADAGFVDYDPYLHTVVKHSFSPFFSTCEHGGRMRLLNRLLPLSLVDRTWAQIQTITSETETERTFDLTKRLGQNDNTFAPHDFFMTDVACLRGLGLAWLQLVPSASAPSDPPQRLHWTLHKLPLAPPVVYYQRLNFSVMALKHSTPVCVHWLEPVWSQEDAENLEVTEMLVDRSASLRTLCEQAYAKRSQHQLLKRQFSAVSSSPSPTPAKRLKLDSGKAVPVEREDNSGSASTTWTAPDVKAREFRLYLLRHGSVDTVPVISRRIDTLLSQFGVRHHVHVQCVREEESEDISNGHTPMFVYHACANSSGALVNFGVPFTICLRKEETVRQFRERLRQLFNVPSAVFDKWALRLNSAQRDEVVLRTSDYDTPMKRFNTHSVTLDHSGALALKSPSFRSSSNDGIKFH